MKPRLSILLILLATVLPGCSPTEESASSGFDVAAQDTQTGEVQWIELTAISLSDAESVMSGFCEKQIGGQAFPAPVLDIPVKEGVIGKRRGFRDAGASTRWAST